MTRACTCGGHIRQHELTGNREAWTCGACGRYSVIQREISPESSAQSQLLDGKDCLPVQVFDTMDESTCRTT